ncbi:MAG: hypothetical protein JW812_00860 [Alphaproteobacteria bacterium]|nr:hypothetical protein [Alphaproteobacteria bacterium]MBN2779786.1 hypothetical protein [Alphaproteobacteria bacterium]
MFDLGFYEFILIGFVLFLILPAQDFPKTMQSIVRGVQKAKNGVSSFFAQFSDPMNEFNDIRHEIEKESQEIRKKLKKK